MAFNYDPRLAFGVLPAGLYPARLMEVLESTSPKGLPMLIMTFNIESEGGHRPIQGWISNPTNLYMLKTLAAALSSESQFEAGTFDPSKHLGAVVAVEIAFIRTAMFGDQNVITGYHSLPSPNFRKQADSIFTATRPQSPRVTPKNHDPASSDNSPCPEDDIPF